MRTAIGQTLRTAANAAAVRFSNRDKGRCAGDGVSFQVDEIKILSETTAAVTMLKSNKLKAVSFFYHLNGGAGWQYFFVSYNHLLGLERVRAALFHVEQHNFEQNND